MTLEENIRQVNSDFVAIKEKIVECGVEVAEGTHTREYAGKVKEVYEAGKKSEYDELWDTFQANGSRTAYDFAFCESSSGVRWVAGKTYRPKYRIKATRAMNMFYNTRLPYEAIAIVDFSECTDFYCTFQYSSTKKFPPIDLRKATRTHSIFSFNAAVEEIEELLVAESTPYNACFNGCSKLKEIRFNGTVGKNGLDFQLSPKLSKASIISIINALSTTTSGLPVILSKTAVETAFGSTTSEEWTALIGTRSNWTISLV